MDSNKVPGGVFGKDCWCIFCRPRAKLCVFGASEPPEPPSRLDTTALHARILDLPCISGRQLGAVAQLVRAPDCLSGGCEFESRPPRFWKPSCIGKAFFLGWFGVESEKSARSGARFSGWGRTEKQALRSRFREGMRYNPAIDNSVNSQSKYF